MKKVILFFGSFNPIHIGHLIVAESALEQTALDKLWFVISPQSPLKKNKSMIHHFDRYEMVRLATYKDMRMQACDIEFNLPKPNYTIDTLSYLKEKYPNYSFALLMGEDNLQTLHKWKNYVYFLEQYQIIVYPRGYEVQKKTDLYEHPSVQCIDVPKIEISASYIRKSLKEHKRVDYLLTEEVLGYIRKKKLW